MFLKTFIILLFICEILSVSLNNNQKCSVNNVNGRCIVLDQCQSAIDGLRKGIRPQSCGFERNTPLVCCVSQNLKQFNSLHEKMCQEFQDEVDALTPAKNGVYGVVGGTNAKAGEYPHMALLGYGNKDDIHWSCGGSLISKSFILTAGHCLNHPIYGEVKHVRLGSIYLDGGSGQAQDYQVVRRIRHPQFQPPIVYNDIALLEINKQVTFSKDIKPACLFTNNNANGLNKITATGWGWTEFGGEPSSILQTVDLELFTFEECNNAYKNFKRRIPNGIIDENQVCAGGRNEERDTCQGDSGGPLQWTTVRATDLHKIIGVTSLGKTCGVASVPAIYTRVAFYIPWIESVAFSGRG